MGLVSGLVAGLVTGELIGLTVGAALLPLLVQAPTASAAAMRSRASNDFIRASSLGVMPTLGRAGTKAACGGHPFPLQGGDKGHHPPTRELDECARFARRVRNVLAAVSDGL